MCLNPWDVFLFTLGIWRVLVYMWSPTCDGGLLVSFDIHFFVVYFNLVFLVSNKHTICKYRKELDKWKQKVLFVTP